MRTNSVNQVNVPQFPELAVIKVFPFVIDNEDVLAYMDYYEDSREIPERWYFYNVLGTLAEDYLQHLIAK